MWVYTYIMSGRTQIRLSDRQHAFLLGEAERTGLSMAELIRRAVDGVYRPNQPPRVNGYQVNISMTRRPDAATIGRWRAPRLRER